VSSEIATSIRRRTARRIPGRIPRRSRSALRRYRRVVGVQLLGPLTILAGIVWAIVQPYRIAFLHPEGKGFYDFVGEPPLLVVLVGLVFVFLIAPGLIDDLERQEHGSEG